MGRFFLLSDRRNMMIFSVLSLKYNLNDFVTKDQSCNKLNVKSGYKLNGPWKVYGHF